MTDAIAPHGGVLVDRVADARLAAELAARPGQDILLDARELADLELLAVGAYSPLTGFMGRADHQRVVAEGRLAAGIVPLRLGRSFHCRRCGGMATDKTCPHDAAEHVVLSGTAVRELLRAGRRPPEEIVRPEVADVLIAGTR
jgi:ATP sulfurylase